MLEPDNRLIDEAARVDRHDLYQRAVQCPDADFDFAEAVFKRRYRRTPQDLREDFSGTSLASCLWVQRGPRRRAWAVDLEPALHDWCKDNNFTCLTQAQRQRVTFVNGDVLRRRRPKVDLVLAQNFSFCAFKTRDVLGRYFCAARAGLRSQGMLVLDMYGGFDSMRPGVDESSIDAFTYHWEQEPLDTISNQIKCHIHFGFDDDSRIERAFSYDWRLWSLVELRELLLEAGFGVVGVYLEGVDEDGAGDGDFRLCQVAPERDNWIAYVVAFP